MQSSLKDLLQRIQTSQIVAASRGRNVTQVGPFRVMLNPDSDMVWLNYAVPIADDFSPQAVADMSQEFVQAGRIPRLEYLELLWPELGAQLEANGFELQSRLPLMICTKTTFKSAHAAAEIMTPESDLEGYIRVADSAFGHSEEITAVRVSRLKGRVRDRNARYSLASVDGEAAAVACLMVEGDVAELAGVGTLDRFRRRGLASAVSRVLLDEMFSRPGADEAVAWLGAGDDAAKSVYEKLGFETIGTQLNMIAKDHA